MKLSLRDADPARDRERLLAALQQEFLDWGDESKFEWLYLKNPFGAARVWTLEDEKGNTVGVSSAFPRRMRLGERRLDGWVLGDFCIAPSHRSLGPALQLQRAAIEAVDRGEVDMWYDFPSRTMTSVYRRLGVPTHAQLVRLVRPLRVDSLIESKLPSQGVARAISAVGNAILSSRDALARRDTSAQFKLWNPETDAPLESLECDPFLHEGVWLDRTPEYLRWRYVSDPRGSSSWIVSDAGTTPSYTVFRVEGDNVAVAEICGNESFLAGLVTELVAVARSRSASSISIAIADEHPWLPIFEKLGFHRREGAPFVVYARAGVLTGRVPWCLMHGDRDL